MSTGRDQPWKWRRSHTESPSVMLGNRNSIMKGLDQVLKRESLIVVSVREKNPRLNGGSSEWVAKFRRITSQRFTNESVILTTRSQKGRRSSRQDLNTSMILIKDHRREHSCISSSQEWATSHSQAGTTSGTTLPYANSRTVARESALPTCIVYAG